MLAKERQDQILNILHHEKKVIRINEIVQRFHVSNETARRDLDTLQSEGLVKRVHGGGVLCEHTGQNAAVFDASARHEPDYLVKQAIGALAARQVEDGDTVFLGTGATILEVARHLPANADLTVLTLSIPAAIDLANRNINTIVLGGQLEPNEFCTYGTITDRIVREFYVDKAFLGAGGITLEHGVTDHALAMDMQVLFEHARQVILCAQSSKFGQDAFSAVCPVSQLAAIVTDCYLSQAYCTGLSEQGTRVLLAQVETETEQKP